MQKALQTQGLKGSSRECIFVDALVSPKQVLVVFKRN
jgi:hypothetical protein